MILTKGWRLCNLGVLVRQIDDLGRVVIPKSFREVYDIKPGDAVEFIASAKGLYLQKSSKYAKCAVTGKITDDLKVYANNIVLSEEGAKMLLESLKNEND